VEAEHGRSCCALVAPTFGLVCNLALAQAPLADDLRGDAHVAAAAGSWDPDGEWADTSGRAYQAAPCTRMLEVCYRTLPK